MRTFRHIYSFFLAAILASGCGEKEGGKFNTVAQSGAGSLGAAAGKDKGKGEAVAPAREDAAPVPAMAVAVAGTDRPVRAASRPTEPQGGILTAGSFDDNLDPRFFQTFVRRVGPNSGLLGKRLLIRVTGSNGAPVGDAQVSVSAAGAAPVHLRTRSDGYAVCLTSWDRLPENADLSLTVTPPDNSKPIRQTVPRGAAQCEVRLPASSGTLPRQLDLAIVLDTTGSMGDELNFLKNEIAAIAGAVRQQFPDVNQRYALVVYRDDGDEYVTRSFDFTGSLEDFRGKLGAQSAGGGGDFPEAMHKGLESAAQLQWRDEQTARVLFLVADAPPHARDLGRTLTAADLLRKKGVAFYPVACSGHDDSTELVMRAAALLTGSQFLFLTDDSGVGNSHADPHIPFYHVQRLDRLMVRMIASELAGKRIEAERNEILRTVGRPIQ